MLGSLERGDKENFRNLCGLQYGLNCTLKRKYWCIAAQEWMGFRQLMINYASLNCISLY